MKGLMKRNLFQLEINRDIAKKVFLFLISPFLGFLVALKRMNTRSSFTVFFLFAVFFGMCFTTSVGKDELNRGDAAAYRYRFEQYRYFNAADISDVFQGFTSMQDSKTRDIYVPLMSFAVAKVSENYHVFFAFLAMVMSVFMLLSFKFLVGEEAFKYSWVCLLLAYFFIRGNCIFNINGCRFWTASWIAIYCNFQLFRNGNRKYLALALLTPMVHSSYWFYLIMLALVYVSGKFTRFWKIAFFVSFFISSVSMQLLQDLSDYLPPALQFLVDRYTDDFEEKGNLYQVLRRLYTLVGNIYLVYMMYLFMKNENGIVQNPKTRFLYQFLLVWMAVIFFVMPIPSLGARYLKLAMPVIAYIWLVAFESRGMYRNVIKIFPLFFMMVIYEEFTGYISHSVYSDFYYTSPIYQIYKYLILGVE